MRVSANVNASTSVCLCMMIFENYEKSGKNIQQHTHTQHVTIESLYQIFHPILEYEKFECYHRCLMYLLYQALKSFHVILCET